MELRTLTGRALDAVLDDLARLRIKVFADFPYLYDGDFAYERRYLEPYRANDGAIVVGAFEGDRLVGDVAQGQKGGGQYVEIFPIGFGGIIGADQKASDQYPRRR